MRASVSEVRDPAVTSIGVGAAGLVELGTGRVRYAPNIAWREVELDEVLASFGVPVAVDNDCTAAAFGEMHAGAGRGVDDFLYVGVGTGIGGGIVMRRQSVRRGAHGFAGEIGHIVVEPGGVRCGCGNMRVLGDGRERLGDSTGSAGSGSAAGHRHAASSRPRGGRRDGASRSSARSARGSARGSPVW